MIGRYFTIALALLGSASAASNPFGAKQSNADAKAKYMAQLMSKATPTENSQLGRNLDGQVEVDLTGYSLRFEKCQFVKAYDQELAANGYETVLATQRFVIFRLCPSGNCKSCNSGYGEYMVDMENYLGYTVEYRQEEQEEMCGACQDACYSDDAAAAGDDAAQDQDQNNYYNRKLAYYSSDCDTCVSACEKIDSMEENHYLDATNFINCQPVQETDDDGGAYVYAGPICASQGSKIKIGVFTDENCMFLDSSKDVDSYLTDEDGNAFKLSHALLKTTYDTSDCISCAADVEGDDDGAAAEVKDVCAELYEASAKCESPYGFDGITSNNYYAQNEAANQVANEELVCDFISSLKSGTYSQDGEIVIGGTKVYTAGGTSTTGGQKFALTFFIIGTVGLAVYAAMLHSQLTKGGKADLSHQGGAMA